MSGQQRNRVRAFFVADPGSSAELVSAAKAFLERGAGIAEYHAHGEDIATSHEVVTMMVGDPELDLVVVLRSQPVASHQVLTAIAAARQNGKPIHVLLQRDVAALVEADESHMIALDRRWETDHDLYAWADSLNERFGKPV